MGFGHPGLGQAECGLGLAAVGLMRAVEGLTRLLPQRASGGEIRGCHLLRLGDELVAGGKFVGVGVSSHGAAASSWAGLRW
ncbi:hypothetical protein D3C71_1799890 [compost metagenome]